MAPVKKYKFIDLFCGIGGASIGLHNAFPDAEITGVDNIPQPGYQFNFILADAMEINNLDEYDFIWSSPPCQAYSRATQKKYRSNHPDLIPSLRKKLFRTNTKWCIENVPGSPLIPTIKLNGNHFGERLYKERWFEMSDFVLSPGRLPYNSTNIYMYNNCKDSNAMTLKQARLKYNLPSMNSAQYKNLIPPYYSEWIVKTMLKG